MPSIAHVSGIYVILNKKSGKIYIGQSYDIKMRWRKHKARLNRGDHDNAYLQYAWNKHGEKTFEFQVLEYCSVEQLDTREQHFLDIYMPKGICYNIATDVLGSRRGIPRSEETKRKISASHLGKKRAPFSAEAIRNITNSRIGRKHTEATKRKMSESAKGRKVTEEARKNMSEANKRRPPPSEETRRKISAANKGHIVSQEQRQKLSELAKARWLEKQKKSDNNLT